MPNLDPAPVPKHKFEFVDEVATADAAFRAEANDLAGLFAACAEALFTTIIDLNQVASSVSRTVALTAGDRETLLYDWLSELVYLKDVNRELYCDFDVEISGDGQLQLTATVTGEAIDSGKHVTRTDVKAVTYHRLLVEESSDGFTAFVVLDL